MTKESRQKLNILRTKKVFDMKQKTFYIIFKGLSVAKNCLRPESAPLNDSSLKGILMRIFVFSKLPHYSHKYSFEFLQIVLNSGISQGI